MRLEKGLLFAAILGGLLSPAASLAAAHDDDASLQLHEREPIALIVITPRIYAGRTRISDIIRGITDGLARRTDLEPVELEGAIAIDCRGQLPCITARVRGEIHSKSPLLLLLVSVRGDAETADLISVVLVDTHRDPIEDGVLAKKAELALDPSAPVADTFAEIVEQDLRPGFEATQHWDPYGEVEIEANAIGGSIRVDGTVVGALEAHRTILSKVTPGSRLITLDAAGHDPFAAQVTVTAHARARLVAELHEAPKGASSVRTFVAGGALVVTGVGIAAGVLALVRSPPSSQMVCFRTGTVSSCPDQGTLLSSADQVARAHALDDSRATKKFVPAAIGFSVGLAGATAAIATALHLEATDFPWLEIAIGIVTGAAGFGASWLVRAAAN